MIRNGIKKLSKLAFVSVVHVFTLGRKLVWFEVICCSEEFGLRFNCSFTSFGYYWNLVAYYSDIVVVLYIQETYVPVFRS